MSAKSALVDKLSSSSRFRSNTDTDVYVKQNARLLSADIDAVDQQCLLPAVYRSRLYQLFGLIEKEFEALVDDNIALQAKVDALSERLAETGNLPPDAEILDASAIGGKQIAKKAIHMGQKLKTALRVPQGRLVSSFKVGSGHASRSRFVRTFDGHRDGVWHVDTCTVGSYRSLLASASADQTACIWSLESGACLVQYSGHSGSVNGISFCPVQSSSSSDSNDLTLVTASGDQSAHIWKAPMPLPAATSSTTATLSAPLVPSSEDELEPMSEKDDTEVIDCDQQQTNNNNTVRQPVLRLTGHTGPVMMADWLCDGEQIITASWDRTANIYDAERGEIISILSGHDQELNHCASHPGQKLVVTASRDSTFRLWDFREPIHSVAVFQGHTESVTSVVFSSNSDKMVSGGDDRSVKVWDLKNMRSSLATIRLDSAANRLAVSKSYNIIAIPHDNRHVRLYDLHGVRLARLPRSNRRCHRRMVCCAAWADDHTSSNLITSGFDKQIIAWKIDTGSFAAKD